jgi:hypothetical protein
VKLLLKIFHALGALVVLLVVVVMLSPQGRAFFGMIRSVIASASSPAAQELTRHGCATALVAPLGELLGGMGKIVDLKDDPIVEQIVAENPTLVFCQPAPGSPAPDCAEVASIYGSVDKTAPQRFGVFVQDGDATACSGYYTPTGQRIGDLEPKPAPAEPER